MTIAIIALSIYSLLATLAYLHSRREFVVYRCVVIGKLREMQTELKRMGEALKGETSEEKHL